MKYIAFFVVLINIYLFYSHGFDGEKGGVVLTTYSSVKKLELLYGEPFGIDERCVLVGAFNSRDEIDWWHAEFDSDKWFYIRYSHKYDRAPRFMVQIPPLLTQKEAVLLSEKLKTEKIDNYVVVGGEYDKAISLGVFENVDSARRLSNLRKSDNYSVKVVELPRAGEEYWLLYKLLESNFGKFSADFASKMKIDKDFLEISCKGVDS